MMMTAAFRNLLPLLAMILLASCGSTPVSRFYMLTPMQQSATSSQTLSGQPLIGIGPIRFPKYLDRPQIVTRSANAEIFLAETDRWAEPLQENFTRVLAENLSRLLGTERISLEPSRNRADVDYRVSAEVIQFDADAHGEVILLAYWNIENKNGTNLTGMQKSEFRLPVSGSAGHAEIVSQLSATIAELGREIATNLGQLSTESSQDAAP